MTDSSFTGILMTHLVLERREESDIFIAGIGGVPAIVSTQTPSKVT